MSSILRSAKTPPRNIDSNVFKALREEGSFNVERQTNLDYSVTSFEEIQ